MKQLFLTILLVCVPSTIVFSQVLKGSITTESGEPIQYATVYIEELKQGTTSNTKGDYEIRLPSGKYIVVYQSLGYQPVYINLTVTDATTTKDVILTLQYYQIPEVRISASGEDPAYPIMRKAIGIAPYYLNNISYYKADVYLKGNLIINKIPKLLQKSMKVESSGSTASVTAGKQPEKKDVLLKSGDTFLMESVNEIEFTAPDKYFQRMISYNSTFPAQGNEISPMSFIQASFYQPVLADMAISPLSPNAFSYYNFRYRGASLQGNFSINKIQVIPKRKSQQLFEGMIYIIEDLWCLQSLDLTNENLVGKIRIQQLFIPVEEDLWMPVSHKFDVAINIVGFKADAGYGSSVRYSVVKPNLSLHKPFELSSSYTTIHNTANNSSERIYSESGKQINKILEKDQLSNRDMVKLARLMKKESEHSLGDSAGKGLEIKECTTQVVDKDANRRDSSYWSNIRPIPLSDIELRSLKVSDSIKSLANSAGEKQNTSELIESKRKITFIHTLKGIGYGHTWKDTSGLSVRYNGILDLKKLRFNSVDGFVYGLDLSLRKGWDNGNSFFLIPDLSWAFSRRKLMWNLNSSYSFNKMKHRQIYFRIGITSKDISNGGGINPLINTFTTLIQKMNYLKLYEARYLTLGYSGELFNGLTFDISANYEDRRVLQNTTKFSFVNSSIAYTDNFPLNSYLIPGSNGINALHDQRHVDFLARFSYTPYQKYRIVKGSKIPLGSDWPTFEIAWQHGVNEFPGIEIGFRHVDMIRFEASKNKSVGAFGNFRWRVRTAGFLDNRTLSFYDFFHINSQSYPLLVNNYEDAFMLPSFYSMSTPEFYIQANMKYTTPYLLLKLLPGLSNTLIRENLIFSFFGSRFHSKYTEIGYSLSEILFLGEIGVYCGFNDFIYRSIGIKATLKFN